MPSEKFKMLSHNHIRRGALTQQMELMHDTVTRRSRVRVMESTSCKGKVKLPTSDSLWVQSLSGAYHRRSFVVLGYPFYEVITMSLFGILK